MGNRLTCCFQKASCAKFIAITDLTICFYLVTVLLIFLVEFLDKTYNPDETLLETPENEEEKSPTIFWLVILITSVKLVYLKALILMAFLLLIAAFRRELKKCKIYYYFTLLDLILQSLHFVMMLVKTDHFDSETREEIFEQAIYLIYKMYSLKIIRDFILEIDEQSVYRPNNI